MSALVGTTAPSQAQSANLPTFTAPSRADDPAVSGTNPLFVNEPATVVDSHGARYVAYQRQSQISVTTDGGRTWTHPGGKSLLTKNVEGCTSNLDDVGDVELAADQNGRVLMADLQVTAGANADLGIQPVVGRSDDSFTTYKATCSAHQPFSVDREWMATYTPPGQGSDNTRVYLTYHDFGPNTMWVNVSKDGGATWSTPTDIITDPMGVFSSICDTVPGGIATDPNTGWVYVVWAAGNDPATNAGTGCNYTQGTVFNHLFVAVSKDEGATWTTTQAVTGHDPTTTDPSDMSEIFTSIAVDRQGGVYVAYPAFGPDGEYGAYMAKSPKADASGQLHFGNGIKVSGADTRTAYFVRLIAGDPGRVDIIYMGSPVKNVPSTPANIATFNGSDATVPTCIPGPLQGVPFPVGKPCKMPANSPWFLYLAQTLDGGASFATQKLREDAVHTGDICTLGIFCLPNDNRDLADTNDIKIDASGGFQVAYTAEAADGSKTEIDFQCQTGGPGLFAGTAVQSCQPAAAANQTAAPAAAPAGQLPRTGENDRAALIGAVLLGLALVTRSRLVRRRR